MIDMKAAPYTIGEQVWTLDSDGLTLDPDAWTVQELDLPTGRLNLTRTVQSLGTATKANVHPKELRRERWYDRLRDLALMDRLALIDLVEDAANRSAKRYRDQLEQFTQQANREGFSDAIRWQFGAVARVEVEAALTVGLMLHGPQWATERAAYYLRADGIDASTPSGAHMALVHQAAAREWLSAWKSTLVQFGGIIGLDLLLR